MIFFFNEIVFPFFYLLGAEDDLKKVTKMAYNQICCYGMNEKIGLLSFPSETSETKYTKPYSRKLQGIIDEVYIFTKIFFLSILIAYLSQSA